MTSGSQLVFVKHSLPEIVENIPAHEWKLSAEGRRRAQMLAMKLTTFQPEVIVSSSEPKARQTAEIIGKELGLDSRVIEGLHEHDRKNSPFQPQDEFQSLIKEFFEKTDMLVFGNETADQTLLRFRHAVESVTVSCDDKDILIVAHGTVISLFVSYLTGIDGYRLWQDLGLPSYVSFDMCSRSLAKLVNIP